MGENKIEKRNDWSEYIGKTKNNPPKPWLIKAMSFVNAKDEALDLGPGAFNDTKFLLSEGFKHIIKRGFPDSLLRHRSSKEVFQTASCATAVIDYQTRLQKN